MCWYEEFIEEGIREEVRLLRNNGFNTVSSCEHEMVVHCDYDLEGKLWRLHKTLTDAGYRNYEITVAIVVVELRPYSHITIKFEQRMKPNSVDSFPSAN